MASSARFQVADFVRGCASTRRGRSGNVALQRFATYLESLPEDDRRPEVLVTIAGSGGTYEPGPAVRNAVVRSLRPGIEPALALEALVIFATAESLAGLRARYRRGEVTS